MKKEIISDAVNNIDDKYISEAMNELNFQTKQVSLSEERIMRRKSFLKVAIVFIACILSVGTYAYAKGYFAMSHREALPNETFSFPWVDEDGNEYQDQWEDAKLVFHFEGVENSSEIEFKEHWLPYAANENFESNSKNRNSEGFRKVLTSELSAEDIGNNSVPGYEVETYYASQFANGGALILLYMEHEEVTKEEYNEFEIVKFSAKNTPADNEIVNYYAMFNSEKGYLILIKGSEEMDILERIAKNLEIRETGNTISSSDFERNVDFLDAGRG